MKYKKVLSIFLTSVLLSGCWDKVEIDRKIFVSTIAIDVGKDIDKQKELKKIKGEEAFSERQLKKLSITYGFPEISEMGPDKGGAAKEQSIKVDASSMEDGISNTALKSSRVMHLAHTKLLLISSDIMEYPEVVKEIIDYLTRQPALNKNMQVAIVKGNAESYVKYKPIMEKNIENYISGLMENSSVNSTILPITLTELLVLLSENGNAIVPSLSLDKEKKELSIQGVAIIQDYSLKGYLNPSETGVLELLRGKIKGGKKVVYKEGHPIDFVIDGVQRKLSLSNENNKLNFTINLEIEGSLKGAYVGELQSFKKETIDELEENLSKSISTECKEITKITQQELTVDAIGFREYIEKFQPSVWKKIKNQWEDSYKNAIVNVNAQVKIRRIGIAK